MNYNGKVTNMFAVREAARLKYGINKSRTLAGLVSKDG